MNPFTTIVAICCLAVAAKARPGIGHTRLTGIPDLQTFGGISYPKYDIIDLGEHSSGFVPGDTIKESRHETLTVPQPYPVKIPIPQPYPVHISKPYPVVETKFVKVPQPVPYEVVKHVPVPVEVPKPYPVPANEHDSHGAYSSQVVNGGNIGGESFEATGPVSNYETQEPNEENASSGLEQENLPQESQGWQPLHQGEH